jgi:hypothetical protein
MMQTNQHYLLPAQCCNASTMATAMFAVGYNQLGHVMYLARHAMEFARRTSHVLGLQDKPSNRTKK